jgi:hypothetical protein
VAKPKDDSFVEVRIRVPSWALKVFIGILVLAAIAAVLPAVLLLGATQH